MKKSVLLSIILLLSLGLALTAIAETRVSGNVNGRWQRDGSPFIATANLTVEDGRTLTIDQGVEVQFEGDFTFFVYGSLLAAGGQGDSIRFSPIPGGESWGGLRLLQCDSTLLDYCVVTGGRAMRGEGELDSLGAGGNIFVSGGNVTIDNSRISRGRSRIAGGGIAIWRARTMVRNTLINENESNAFGGGVAVSFAASPTFSGCSIIGNITTANGGGIWVFVESTPLFESCIVKSNRTTNVEAGNGGGAFMAEAASPRFIKTKFLENSSTAGGGAYMRGGGTSPTFEWCYIYGNAANNGSRVGGGLYARGGASPTIRYCRFVENNANQGGGIYVKEVPHFPINHCLFLRNAATARGGAVGTAEDCGDNPLILNNCTFIDNRNIGGEPVAHTASARRPRDQLPGSRILINSSIVFGPAPLFADEGRIEVKFSNVQGGFQGPGNTDEDPGFFAADSIWFVLSGNSRCVDSGDTTIARDPDDTRSDRGWLHFPHDAWESLPDEPLSVEQTADERTTLQFSYRNETGVPIYVTPLDRWNEGAREMFINVSALTNDTEVHAVAYTSGGFFLAGGNNGNDPNYIYHVDEDFNLLGRFEQPGANEDDGFTDMATDGESILYGSVDDFIIEFTADGEFGQDYLAPREIALCRGIASDFKHSDGFVDFYLGGNEGQLVRADAGMFKLDQINVGDTILAVGAKGNTRAAYAITNFDDRRAMLWLITPEDNSATPLYTLAIPDDFHQGGIEVTQDFRSGRGFLIGILEGDNDNGDRLYALDLYTAWLVIKPSLSLLLPGEEMEWPIEFAGDEMPVGFHEADFYLAVNGYGEGGEVAAQMTTTPGKVAGDEFTPDRFALASPYPNPFNAQARISFRLAHASYAEMWLTDANGRSIQRLMGGYLESGSHSTHIDASMLPAGQYFVRLVTGETSMVRPLTLIK